MGNPQGQFSASPGQEQADLWSPKKILCSRSVHERGSRPGEMCLRVMVELKLEPFRDTYKHIYT